MVERTIFVASVLRVALIIRIIPNVVGFLPFMITMDNVLTGLRDWGLLKVVVV